jgi:hypothetical protein
MVLSLYPPLNIHRLIQLHLHLPGFQGKSHILLASILPFFLPHPQHLTSLILRHQAINRLTSFHSIPYFTIDILLFPFPPLEV